MATESVEVPLVVSDARRLELLVTCLEGFPTKIYGPKNSKGLAGLWTLIVTDCNGDLKFTGRSYQSCLDQLEVYVQTKSKEDNKTSAQLNPTRKITL